MYKLYKNVYLLFTSTFIARKTDLRDCYKVIVSNDERLSILKEYRLLNKTNMILNQEENLDDLIYYYGNMTDMINSFMSKDKPVVFVVDQDYSSILFIKFWNLYLAGYDLEKLYQLYLIYYDDNILSLINIDPENNIKLPDPLNFHDFAKNHEKYELSIIPTLEHLPLEFIYYNKIINPTISRIDYLNSFNKKIQTNLYIKKIIDDVLNVEYIRKKIINKLNNKELKYGQSKKYINQRDFIDELNKFKNYTADEFEELFKNTIPDFIVINNDNPIALNKENNNFGVSYAIENQNNTLISIINKLVLTNQLDNLKFLTLKGSLLC